MSRSAESSKHTVCLLALLGLTIWIVFKLTLQLEAVARTLAGGISGLYGGAW